MDWANERWVKLYTRDTGDWLLLSYAARSLFLHLIRLVNAEGQAHLGKDPHRAIECMLHAKQCSSRATENSEQCEIRAALEELVLDGGVTIDTNGVLTLQNFKIAQECPTSDPERARRYRESRRVTDRHAASRDVTDRHDQSRSEEIKIRELGVERESAERERDLPLPPVAQPTKLKKETARRTTVPDDFRLSAPVLAWAKARGWGETEAVHEFGAFCDHHRAKGTLGVDWAAGFRTWLRNSEKWERERKLRVNRDREAKLAADPAVYRAVPVKSTRPVFEENPYVPSAQELDLARHMGIPRLRLVGEK